MIKNILIPQDGSRHSAAALDYGIWLGKRLNVKLIGLYVVDLVAMEGPFFHDLSGSLGFEPLLNFSSKMREILEAKGEDILKAFADSCEAGGFDSEVNIDFGIVVNEICQRTRVADLVIMGRRGVNERFEYGLLGSTTEGVIRKAEKPILVVPDTFNEPAHPLLAYDGSASAAKAMHSAAELTQNLGLDLTVISVSKDESSEISLAEAKDYLEPYNIKAEFIARTGDGHSEIARCYKENGHDLLFMGTSHHSKIVEMVLGSTTEYVLRSIDGPVFLER